MRTPTKQQIAGEVRVLEGLLKMVPQRTLFGDNNHDAIRAQIWVLKHACDETKVANRYLPADGADEPTEDDRAEGRTFEIEAAARDALYWKLGEREIARPSEDWKGLVDAIKRKRPTPSADP